ncbi:MAG: hypothetical protein U0610_19135 [bacterium]
MPIEWKSRGWRSFAGGLALAVSLPGLAIAAGDDGETDSGARAAAQFDALDANHDGWVTKAEAAKDPSVGYDALLAVGDANGDGRLSRGEFESAVNEIAANGPGADRGDEQPEALFVQWDENRDDRLSVGEVPAARRAEVERILDALGRKGGTLSFEEFLAHFGKDKPPSSAKP